jgi:hypothetical protein
MNDAEDMRAKLVASFAMDRPGFGEQKMNMQEEQNTLLKERYNQINQKYEEMYEQMYQDLNLEYDAS